ncbi:interleukin-17D [Brachyhypopomus gauderio]|uniref:interleukin-17D n=1 Tax=Brachyhypopomus gauderio TaxID=698409 RepID=UPI004042863A
MLGRVFLLPFLLLLVSWAGTGSDAKGMKASRRTSRNRSCLDLPEEILEQMFGRLSVGVLSAFHHTLVPGRLNLSCPSAGRLVADRRSRTPVNVFSLSPWGYRISHDPARYPRFIPEAYCLCKGCLTGPNGEESHKYRSVPVYVPTAVLRRTGSCAGGRRSYTESYVSVAVGCTCVPALQDIKAPGRNRSSPRATPQFTTGKKLKKHPLVGH